MSEEEDWEDCETQAVYIEFVFEAWAALADLNAETKNALYRAVSETLATVRCPVQAIKARTDALHVLAEVCIEMSVDDVANIVVEIAKSILSMEAAPTTPPNYSAYSISPSDMVSAVVSLG